MFDFKSIRWLILAVLACLLSPQLTFASQTVVLAAIKKSPYVTPDASTPGYVVELITEAYKSQGIEVEIKYYPAARATKLARLGDVDGVFPVYSEPKNRDQLIYSDSIPGDGLWAFKKKTNNVREDVHKLINTEQKGPVSFAIKKSQYIDQKFIHSDKLNIHVANYEINLLDMLDVGRVDYILLDKYTAADLMVGYRPHLIGQLKMIDEPFYKRDFHVGFNVKKNKQHTDTLNKGLALLMENGRYKSILESNGIFINQVNLKKSDAQKTILNVAAISTEFLKNIKSMTALYESKHKNVKINWHILDENVLRRRIMEDITLGEGNFDVLTIGAYETLIWAKKGWIQPIKNIPESYDVNDLLQPVRSSAQHKNTFFALPFTAEGTLAYYRKDLFAQSGISLPPEIDYRQLDRYLSKVHDPDNGVYGLAVRGKAGWGQNMAFISILVNSFGGQWFDLDWNPTIDTDEWRNALTFYRDIVKKYGHPETYKHGWKENQNLFIDGKVAYLIDSSSTAPVLFNDRHKKIRGNVEVAHAPININPKGSNWLWWWGLAINSQSKKVQAATDFVLWATSKEYAEQIVNAKGFIAMPPGVRRSSITDEHKAEVGYVELVQESIERASAKDFTLNAVPYTGPQFVAIPEFPAIGDQVGAKVALMLKGEKSVGEVIRESQALVRKIMENSGYYD